MVAAQLRLILGPAVFLQLAHLCEYNYKAFRSVLVPMVLAVVNVCIPTWLPGELLTAEPEPSVTSFVLTE